VLVSFSKYLRLSRNGGLRSPLGAANAPLRDLTCVGLRCHTREYHLWLQGPPSLQTKLRDAVTTSTTPTLHLQQGKWVCNSTGTDTLFSCKSRMIQCVLRTHGHKCSVQARECRTYLHVQQWPTSNTRALYPSAYAATGQLHQVSTTTALVMRPITAQLRTPAVQPQQEGWQLLHRPATKPHRLLQTQLLTDQGSPSPRGLTHCKVPTLYTEHMTHH
jgi:hypothetical protein